MRAGRVEAQRSSRGCRYNPATRSATSERARPSDRVGIRGFRTVTRTRAHVRHIALRSGVARRAFSLVELVMVVATLGIIAMIAIPRLAGAAANADAAAMVANVTVLQNAIDIYAAEHNNLNPTQDGDRSVNRNGVRFAARLTGPTDDAGRAGGLFGPYLLRVPRNPDNDKNTIPIDGVPLGANLAGWRYSSARGIILPDDMDEAMAITILRVGYGSKGAVKGGLVAVEAFALTPP